MLSRGIEWILYSALKLDPGSRLVSGIDFILYDFTKIILLLFLMVSAIGFLRTYLPQEKVKDWLGKKGAAGNFFAALFGAMTPFCSCSSIPLFVGFLEAGIPLGVTFSFLVTSPLINKYIVVLMFGFFGLKITVLYVLSGIFLGVLAGVILGRMNLERYLIKGLVSGDGTFCRCLGYSETKERFLRGINEAAAIVKKLWVWVFVAVGIGAAIRNYVPQEAVHAAMERTGFFAVPMAVILGVPMYANCATIVPIAVVLFQKGVPVGTALAFVMAVAALSVPEATMLKKVMTLRLVAIFFGVTSLGIMLIGYLFNFLVR